MLRGFGWLSVAASLAISSIACVSTEPGDIEEDAPASQALAKGSAKGGDAKVTVCHVPPGNPDNAHAIEVGAAAVGAHLAHGDTLGDCDAGDEGEGDGGGDEGDEGGGLTPGGSGPVCAADGAACSAGADCCSGTCGGSGICVSQCTVGPELGGSACSANNDCCSGSCIDGSCYEGWSCNLPGTACNPDSESAEFWCCFGLSCGADGLCQ